MVLSFAQRDTASVVGSLAQQIPSGEIDIQHKIHIFYEFLKHLVKTFPVWLIFPILILPVIKVKRDNHSILVIMLFLFNLIAMFISESHFIRYVLITIIARLFLVSDLVESIKARYSLIVAGPVFIFQLVVNPPPISELYYKEDSVLKISSYLKEVDSSEGVLLSDYAYFNFHSGLKGTSVSGYISGGSVKTGEIDSKRLIGVIEKEGVKYILIHSEGRVYYPYGAEIYYYEPHHIRGIRDFNDFKRYIDTYFVLDKIFYAGGAVFELYRRG